MVTVKEKKVVVKKGEIISEDNNLFHEGKNYNSYRFMGSHYITENRKRGIRFTTWAPKASCIYVVGDFCDFKPMEEYKLKKITDKGLWSIFIPALKPGCKYKYYIVNQWGTKGVYKADPYAYLSEVRPNTASIVKEDIKFKWNDRKWINKRKKTNIYESPLNIYEVHLGSWKTKDGEFLTYEELAEELPKYLVEMGYTHIEMMPLIEHPLDASWGYQGVGYYSPTSRYGNPEGLKHLISELHKNDIGVILDWAPSHFCKDEHGLYMFDGGPTYEYEEGWKADNKGWGTSNFDLGKPEVKSFLISNALYWIREFHVDGLRVDAVSNIIYLDYGRNEGEWIPNKYGENGCLEGIEFLKELNTAVFAEFENVLMVAEESTSWPNVSKPVNLGGLGFNFKWNMGWMNDTLEYIEVDPIYRKYHHNKLNFSMMYNYSENFILPISHDEVVHGKKSLVDKMWGDYWNKFAGLRLFSAFMIGHPGKKLLFMGSEFGQFIEWREYEQLEWKLIKEFETHKKTQNYFKELNEFYKENKALWELDYDEKGFQWIDADNNKQSILTFIRKGRDEKDTLIFICNFTPIVYYDFEVGVPYLADYKEVFNTDEVKYGGSGQVIEGTLVADNLESHSQPYSIKIKVPPMGVSVIAIDKFNNAENDTDKINAKDNKRTNKKGIKKNKRVLKGEKK
ncbi:1,4-alpha-glucan branching protein GlgB [Clostridium chauvoei]|uniref:1,4-alpha-glucan branching enzyme GlgB n=2 Tax=Clostridium chauvoei TaxID=46867 RepID=A0A1U6JRE1_9CLOT|nr:1,4-alpha-glucan branching protein GlgB [Clostridium chauvoei]MBX7281815.1 1,4-alpha-glucan branching protein GlgB [Clostridium chauvoei]MBX7284336.1 1,4-alpha-glucan branching protein GlgB [Clostridium chauvoei]MBX7286844.1 1,4-alpha-glucan branching protein GlgB [Clostridium chauvoei]MBX7289380.1 1,4-alpha-glucan branching protein GlgB [Clostridium chauvoei]MBX7291894.1 1,4-alpha-glucan branching protein GlgB [Clostridium chauvoei]